MFGKIRNASPQMLFIIIGLIYGLCFLVTVPPFQVADEPLHFDKIFQVSDGKLIPEPNGGGYIPKSVDTTLNQFGTNFKYDHLVEDSSSSLGLPLNNNDRITINGIIGYPPVPYMAAAFTVDIGKIFNSSPLLLMYLCRLANLLVWLFLVYLTIKITPVHKWVFLLLGLMPMTILQAASLSADSFTLGISFLVIAFFLKLALDNKKKIITEKDIVILFTLTCLLSLSKQIYIVLTLLVFMIPSYKFRNKKKMFLTYFIVFFTALTILGSWSYLGAGVSTPNHMSADNRLVTGESYHIPDIAENPVGFFQLLTNTFFSEKLYTIGFVGTVGGFATPTRLSYLYILILILIALMDKKEGLKVSLKDKTIMLAPLVLVLGGIIYVSYLSWTPFGNGILKGIQGRYFIPVAPLLFLLFYNTKKRISIRGKGLEFKKTKNFNSILTIFIVVFLAMTLIMIVRVYYSSYLLPYIPLLGILQKSWISAY
jgi:uncharacterized membrane protein